MFMNYLKIAFRNLLKHKGYSFINIAGFAIGIAACILMVLYVQDELSYDRFHELSDRTYRITVKGRVGGNDFNLAVSCAPVGYTLVREFPEVEQAARFHNFGFPVLRYEDKVFSEERFFTADSTIFDVFTIPFIAGNPKTALTKPGSVVLTRSSAQKYFGDDNPIGKTLNADNRRDWLVTGVVEDFPVNSHFHFDFMGSLATNEDSRNQIWISNNYYTYIVLREGATPEQVEAKLPALIKKYAGPQIESAFGATFDEIVAAGASYGFFLQPLTDIHLYSDLDYEVQPGGSAAYVMIFTIVAIGILLIACINFMNLATARSANRAKEVGIRKTLGSLRQQLIRQFMSETVFLTMLSVALAIIFVQVFLPTFNAISGKNLSLSMFADWYAVVLLTGITVFVGLFAGSYPAFFLAAFQPVNVLKGESSRGSKGGSPFLRSILVVFQFSIWVILLIGTLVVNDQLSYVQKKKLGFNKEQILIVEKTDDLGEQVYPFMHELSRHKNILAASNTTSLPGKPFFQNVHQLPGAASEDNYLLFEIRTDHDFAQAYEIEMAAGRYFAHEWSTDSSAIVINETAARTLGFTDPVGKIIVGLGRTPQENENYKVVGVMKDFHFESLHQKIRPMAIKLFPRGWTGRYVSVRVTPENMPETLQFMEDTWKKFAGAQAFEYVFFDQEFARLYDSEMTTQRIITLFTAIAIIIACLGLFALASFITELRTKEVGIRKVLGASMSTIVLLLTRQFVQWVILANLIAWPIAYFTMNSWLQNFAYRTDLGIFSFIVAAGSALVISLITVGYQTTKAALANPVDSLQYE